MAKKTSLRDFQAYLAGRLTTAAQGRGASSWLGVRAGDENWLIDLSDSGEIVLALKLTAVPLTIRQIKQLDELHVTHLAAPQLQEKSGCLRRFSFVESESHSD